MSDHNRSENRDRVEDHSDSNGEQQTTHNSDNPSPTQPDKATTNPNLTNHPLSNDSHSQNTLNSATTNPSRTNSTDSNDGYTEWDNYVPDGIFISEERRQELREESRLYLKELIEEVGEPSPDEMARAEAWWRPIEQHLKKSTTE